MSHRRAQPLQHLDLAGVIRVMHRNSRDQLALRPALALRQGVRVLGDGDSPDHCQESLVFVSQQLDVSRPRGGVGPFRKIWPVGWTPWKTRRGSALEATPHRVFPIRDVERELPDALAARCRRPDRIPRGYATQSAQWGWSAMPATTSWSWLDRLNQQVPDVRRHARIPRSFRAKSATVTCICQPTAPCTRDPRVKRRHPDDDGHDNPELP